MFRRVRLLAVGCAWVGAAFAAFGAAASRGQAVAPGPVSPDLGPAVRALGEEVRRLGQDVASDLRDAPGGRPLLDEANELARAVDEFRDALNAQADRFALRQAYAGIDGSWHHLAGELSRAGGLSPAIDRDVQRVAQADARIHAALGLNEYPAGYYGGNQALSGAAEVQRLAHALVDRAEALAAAVRLDMPGADEGRVLQDAVNLASVADTFHDALNINGRVDATMQNGFAPVAGMGDRLAAEFARVPPTPRVQAAWRAYRSAEVLMRPALGLPNPAESLTGTLLAPAPQPGAASPVVALADQLVQQASAFLQVFGPTAGAVPEGALFLADAQALLAAATDFRQDAARGLNPAQLAFEFRDVDAIWQRLARRTNRIARGRTGPNIQQVGRMGQTIAEIHRLLGVPGYAPAVTVGP